MYQIDQNAITTLHTINDSDGLLCPIEDSMLPFEIRRMFYVCNVPRSQVRGNHAHYETEQILICLKGQIIVGLYNGYGTNYSTLNPNQAIYIDKMVWDNQTFITGDEVMLVLCSTNYDPSDYINDIDEFNRLIDEKDRNTH
jgi:dTDP-4-dehydrorhamnose 3,5-epimerase-like enzyme